MIVTRKMIKILTRGPLREKSGVYGPINSPYMEKVSIIAELLKNGKKVVEVMPGNIDVPLSLENYNIGVEVEYVEPKDIKPTPVVITPKVEYTPVVEEVLPVVEEPIEVVEEVIEEPVVEESVEVVEESSNELNEDETVNDSEESKSPDNRRYDNKKNKNRR